MASEYRDTAGGIVIFIVTADVVYFFTTDLPRQNALHQSRRLPKEIRPEDTGQIFED